MRNLGGRIFLFVLFVYVCPSIQLNLNAEKNTEIKKLSLQEAVRTALENNSQITSAAIESEVKRRNYIFSWNSLVPKAELAGSLSRRNKKNIFTPGLSLPPPLPSIPSSEKTLSENELWSAAGVLKIGWVFSPAMIESIVLSKKDYEAGKISLARARINLKKQVAKAYFGLSLQSSILKIAQRNLEESGQKLKEAKLNYKNGRVPELTVLSTEIEVANQKLNLQKAQSLADEQFAMFAFLLGFPYGTKIEIDESAVNVDYKNPPEIKREAYFSSQFNLDELKKNAEVLNSQIKILQIQTYSPVLSVSHNFTPVITPIDSKWGDKKNWNDSGSFNITLSFNLTNLLPFSSQSIAVRNAKDSAKKLQLTINAEVFNREMEFDKLKKKLKESAESIRSMELQNELAKKAYQLTKAAYYAGQKTLLELSNAETISLQTELALSREKFSYVSALIDLGLYPLP